MIAENSNSRKSVGDNGIGDPSTNGHRSGAEILAEIMPDPANPGLPRRNDALTDAEVEGFWAARPELERLRQFARSRRVGPWAVLGHVLAISLSAIPPNVVLPPTIGDYASLNLFVALVGRSGNPRALRCGRRWHG